MSKPKTIEPEKVCGDCVHLSACSAWNCSSLQNTNAMCCANYQTPRQLYEELRGIYDGES